MIYNDKNKEKALQWLLNEFDKLYDTLIETEYFSVVYDKQEEEWFYIIDEEINLSQLVKAKNYFFRKLVSYMGIERIVNELSVKPFTIKEFIDNSDSMMRDKNLYDLYRKFNFMIPSFL